MVTPVFSLIFKKLNPSQKTIDLAFFEPLEIDVDAINGKVIGIWDTKEEMLAALEEVKSDEATFIHSYDGENTESGDDPELENRNVEDSNLGENTDANATPAKKKKIKSRNKRI